MSKHCCNTPPANRRGVTFLYSLWGQGHHSSLAGLLLAGKLEWQSGLHNCDTLLFVWILIAIWILDCSNFYNGFTLAPLHLQRKVEGTHSKAVWALTCCNTPRRGVTDFSNELANRSLSFIVLPQPTLITELWIHSNIYTTPQVVETFNCVAT